MPGPVPSLLKVAKHRITNCKDQEEPYYCEIGFNFRKNPEQVFDDLYYISVKNNNHLFFLKKKIYLYWFKNLRARKFHVSTWKASLKTPESLTCPTLPGCFKAKPPLETAAATFPSWSTTTAPTVSKVPESFSCRAKVARAFAKHGV